MKLASFHAHGRDRIGAAIADDALIDLAEAAAAAGGASGIDALAGPALVDLIAFIEAGEPALAAAHRLLELARSRPGSVARYRVEDIRWHAPVRRPSKLVCLALNNSANKDRILSGPNHPASFIKGANALTGHREPIIIRSAYGRCHPEPELAVVIGRRAKDIRAADAYGHVFGYTIHNDITSPTMRGEDTFHYRAIHPAKDDPSRIEYVETWVSYPGRYKGSDTFSPLGPWLVTRDEIPNAQRLNLWLEVNGKRMQTGNTRTMIFNVRKLVAYVSHFMALEPGDVIVTGTPPGVGMGRKPPRYLKEGDIVTLGGDGLGVQMQEVIAWKRGLI